MVKTLVVASALSAFVGGALAQAGPWGQCGGTGWTGATTCQSGWVCTAVSPPWYYQCLQGTAPTTTPTTTSTKTSTTYVDTSRSLSSTSSTRPSSSSSTRPTSSGSTTTPISYPSTSTTSTAPVTSGTQYLTTGNSFIRGVEAPFFHQYLQSEVLGTASDAVLGSPSTAAQFQIVSGQLIQNPQGTKLYAQVEAYTSGANKLKVSWSTSPGTFGTFLWSGDTLEWSDPSVSRPQLNAWLICADAAGHNDVYINLGSYSYMTPAGCGDQTIHAYTGPYANS